MKRKTTCRLCGGDVVAAGTRRHICRSSLVRRAMLGEAAASVSLDKGDGATQFCDACVAEQHGLPRHRCGKEPMTPAERELVEAALLEPGLWINGRLHKAIDAVLRERAAREAK